MRKIGDDPEKGAASNGVSARNLWEWYHKGTRLILVATAGKFSFGYHGLN
jgi:hypothetical protein